MQFASYLQHLIKARTRHGVHSPFVYDLIEQVLRARPAMPEHADIEALREDLLRSDQTIRVNDLGAGSRSINRPVRRVADMARVSLKPARQAQLLFRLARILDARHVLELGTCFGLTTLYLARGAENGVVRTIEGCPQTYRIAQHHFEQLRQHNIDPSLGSFSRRLPEVLDAMGRVDLAFIDGFHAEAPTLEHFDCIRRYLHNDSVVVLDDIHWSPGMEAAWKAIQEAPGVTVTIDLYDMGLVFFRKEQAKQHFRLRY
jgi:predicted O-methyltransferase YrrM